MRIRLISAAALLTLAIAPAFAAPVTYKLDPTHTNVLAQWSHFGFSHPFANFGDVEGVLVYDAADVGKSSVQVTLPLSGLEAFSPKFNEHLRSADFFDAARYPAATFKSTRVEAAGTGKLKVSGDLTIKDNTHPVVLDVTLNKAGAGNDGRPKIGFDASTTIKRSAWDIDYVLPMVSDDVAIDISIAFEKQ